MGSLLLMGAGAGNTGGSSLWNPGMESSLIGWWDQSTDRYDGTTWTPRYGSLSMVKDTTGPTETSAGIDGSTRALIFTGNSNTQLLLNNPNVNEFISVYVLTVTGRTNDVLIMERTTHTTTRTITFTFGGMRVSYLGGDTDDYTVDPLNSPCIMVCRHSKASRIGRYNGTQVLTGATGTTGTEGVNNQIRLGPYTIGQNWTYNLSCFAVFDNAAWSTGLAEKIEGYIAHQGTLGVTTALLPGGHTYKSSPPAP